MPRKKANKPSVLDAVKNTIADSPSRSDLISHQSTSRRNAVTPSPTIVNDEIDRGELSLQQDEYTKKPCAKRKKNSRSKTTKMPAIECVAVMDMSDDDSTELMAGKDSSTDSSQGRKKVCIEPHPHQSLTPTASSAHNLICTDSVSNSLNTTAAIVARAAAAVAALQSESENSREGTNEENEVIDLIQETPLPQTQAITTHPLRVVSQDSGSITDKSKAKAPKEVDSDYDSERERQREYFVEYTVSCRATCRRCDQVIPKGSLRISHVPLFRGKPGYRVFRHLDCSVFPAYITRPEDIGGWQKLHDEDYENVAHRIDDSIREVAKENEEISPDELVQAAFQGEIRKPPPGLVGSLLPFQTEGVSWMYHQEVHTSIRGGILADEMGMGKSYTTSMI
jgi:SNF2 family DNA or RNA helicase